MCFSGTECRFISFVSGNSHRKLQSLLLIPLYLKAVKNFFAII
uniref:Uncharacterized protein n=1 Tax=Siphoviridae sp. ctwQT14 TaxID=2827971 RepID=A0A8S5TL93_9CAUD|nr:MAG TPA: hypothetical protein [Siphoviridae sp. ctwQT14]